MTTTPRIADARSHADIIVAAVRAATDAYRLTVRALVRHPIDAQRVDVLAFGKASIAMARAACEVLGPRVHSGAVLAVPEHAADLDAHWPRKPSTVTIFPADHPLPSQRNIDAAARLRDYASALPRRSGSHALCILISGGGSAHLSLPADTLILNDLRELTSAMLRAGAPIDAINCVRKHCELLKGGQLARLTAGIERRVLVLSDVIGDRLDVIASGPCAPDATTFTDALNVLDHSGLSPGLPRVCTHLQRGARGEIADTPKPLDACFADVRTRIIANNRRAVAAVRASARALGFTCVHRQLGVTSDARAAGESLAAAALHAADAHESPVSIVIGGETTVRAGAANGVGGRAQELALAASLTLAAHPLGARVAVLSFATDGIDGPTDAAGALITADTVADIGRAGIDPHSALADHDSYTALSAAGCLIRTGPTGTNVNDVAVALVYPPPAR